MPIPEAEKRRIMANNSMFEATTIIAVTRNGKTAVAGDGQVTMSNTMIMKNGARKVRRLYNGKVVAGFAGAVADAFTLFDKFEVKLNEYRGNLMRASVELVNLSDKYLEEARLTIVLSDDTALEFLVQDLPAGMTVWAFETGNQSIADDAKCETIDCTAQFLDAQPLMSGISTEANGASLTVTNQTGADIAVLTLRVHCLFENVFFGGKSVEYTIDNLANGASAEITAAECYMGTAQAASIR